MECQHVILSIWLLPPFFFPSLPHQDLTFALPLVLVMVVIVVIFVVVVYMLYRAKRGYFCCLTPVREHLLI